MATLYVYVVVKDGTPRRVYRDSREAARYLTEIGETRAGVEIPVLGRTHAPAWLVLDMLENGYSVEAKTLASANSVGSQYRVTPVELQ